jgi:hypothetical protein
MECCSWLASITEYRRFITDGIKYADRTTDGDSPNTMQSSGGISTGNDVTDFLLGSCSPGQTGTRKEIANFPRKVNCNFMNLSEIDDKQNAGRSKDALYSFKGFTQRERERESL